MDARGTARNAAEEWFHECYSSSTLRSENQIKKLGGAPPDIAVEVNSSDDLPSGRLQTPRGVAMENAHSKLIAHVFEDFATELAEREDTMWDEVERVHASGDQQRQITPNGGSRGDRASGEMRRIAMRNVELGAADHRKDAGGERPAHGSEASGGMRGRSLDIPSGAMENDGKGHARSNRLAGWQAPSRYFLDDPKTSHRRPRRSF
jgi:hypothetical protein